MTAPATRPFASVDEAEVQRVFTDWRGKPSGEIDRERKAVENDMARAFEQAGTDLELEKIDSLGGATLAEKTESLVKLHSRLSGVEDALRERTELEQVRSDIRSNNRGGGSASAEPVPTVAIQRLEPPSLTDRVYADLRERGVNLASEARRGGGVSLEAVLPGRDILDTLFETDDGWDPFVSRMPGYVPSPQRPVQVTDIFPRFPTNQHAVKYMEETTFTNAAVEVAEGGSAPGATLELTERTESVQKIAVHIPVTEEQLEDEDQVRAYLDDRLMFMLRQRLDGQLLLGDGTSPNISGALDRTGVQDQEWTHDDSDVPEKPINTLRAAKTKVVVGGRAMPSHFVIHHNIWDTIATSESESGGYYLGSPANPFAERMWGLPVVLSDHLDDGTEEDKVGAVVGDFRNFSALHVRRDFTLDVGVSNDDFLKGQMRIRGTVRVALAVYRPKAFCQISRPA